MDISIKELIKKHDELVSEKQKLDYEYSRKIADLYAAIEMLSGKKAETILFADQYDDENPSYITGTEDGI